MKPLISVIIPTHNSAGTIVRCINSIISQSVPRDQFEIIVVDDGSKDETIKLAKSAGADLVLLIEPCFQGKARNVGVSNAKASLLAFIDSDCEAEEGWLNSILRGLNKFDAISGPIENGSTHSAVGWAEYYLEFSGYNKNRNMSTSRVFLTCNGACTKDAFQRAGGFIESENSEDVLFGKSLDKSGIKILFISEMQIRHHCRTELSKLVNNMEKLGKFFVRSRKKYPSLPYSFMVKSRWVVPSVFFGKIFGSATNAFTAKKLNKFLYVFPLIIVGSFSFYVGAWKEFKNQ